MQTPLLLLWFNRPHLARQVLDRLRTVQPSRLFIAIDGPRTSHPADTRNVADCVSLLDEIDWPCTVITRISPHNQGCKYGVSTAVNWFFEQADEGIILEDDCLPNPTFFSYCADLLDRYRYDERVVHISGANLYGGLPFGPDSYFFSPVPHVWGWASWRRAWQSYDVTMAGFPDFVARGGIDAVITNKRSARFWQRIMLTTYRGTLDNWDHQWVWAIWQQNGLCITPNQNLITNIGYGPDATHTTIHASIANLPTIPMPTINHPNQLIVNEDALRYASERMFVSPGWLAGKVARLRQIFLTQRHKEKNRETGDCSSDNPLVKNSDPLC